MFREHSAERASLSFNSRGGVRPPRLRNDDRGRGLAASEAEKSNASRCDAICCRPCVGKAGLGRARSRDSSAHATGLSRPLGNAGLHASPLTPLGVAAAAAARVRVGVAARPRLPPCPRIKVMLPGPQAPHSALPGLAAILAASG